MKRKAILALLALVAASVGAAWVWTSTGGASIPMLSLGGYHWRLNLSVYNLNRSLRIIFPRSTARFDDGPVTSPHDFAAAQVTETVVGPRLGFSYKHTVAVYPNKTIRVTGVDVPLWMLVLACGGYPAYVYVRGPLRRRRRRQTGRCVACGYRLAGNTSGVCPECGKAI